MRDVSSGVARRGAASVSMWKHSSTHSRVSSIEKVGRGTLGVTIKVGEARLVGGAENYPFQGQTKEVHVH